jgi:hypothetical protein
MILKLFFKLAAALVFLDKLLTFLKLELDNWFLDTTIFKLEFLKDYIAKIYYSHALSTFDFLHSTVGT